MNSTQTDRVEINEWDPRLISHIVRMLRTPLRWYFRTEIRGLDRIPGTGGALLVSNHSGGRFAVDLPVLAVNFYDRFGYDRPLHALGEGPPFFGPVGSLLMRAGVIRGDLDDVRSALASGHLVVVFPGGDDDAYRSTLQDDEVHFDGHNEYAKTAIDAKVPIVPVVSMGGQENQFYVTSGTWLVKLLGPLARFAPKSFPVSIGFPFGLTIGKDGPPNLPLPTKIITEVLSPIRITTAFGKDPDAVEVDNHVRALMQRSLDRLAEERRLPILG